MIDAHNALRAYLIEPSDLRTLLGGSFVYTPQLPDNRTGLQKNITFRVTGGQTHPNLRAQVLRVAFRCYGEPDAGSDMSAGESARAVYRALYDRLHDKQNFIVGDVGFHGAIEEVPGAPLEDPVTNWPFVFAVYSIRVATVPVTAA